MRKNSVKNSRINGEVQRVLAEVIRGEIKDPRIAPMTSVVDVEVAPDLKTCRAYISVLGSEEEAAATLEGLKSAEGFIRGRLAKEINLRNTPEIHFIMDQSIAYGVNMSHKIDMVMADQRAKKERKRMRKILEELGSRDTIAIGGHVRPDGDCVGSCMGMYLYLKKRCRMHRLMCIWKACRYFDCIHGIEDVRTDCSKDCVYDVFIVLDTSKERLGDAEKYFRTAKRRSMWIIISAMRPAVATLITANRMQAPPPSSSMSFWRKSIWMQRLQRHCILASCMTPVYSSIRIRRRIHCVSLQSCWHTDSIFQS